MMSHELTPISLDFLLAKANHSLNILDNVANAFSLYNNDPAGELSAKMVMLRSSFCLSCRIARGHFVPNQLITGHGGDHA